MEIHQANKIFAKLLKLRLFLKKVFIGEKILNAKNLFNSDMQKV